MQNLGNIVTGTKGSGKPKGTAGGDLTGAYPNPELTPTGVVPGAYSIPNITVNPKGRITNISNGVGFRQALVSITSNAQTLRYFNPVFGSASAGSVGLVPNRVYATPFLFSVPTTVLGIAHNFRDIGTSGTFRASIYSGNVGELGTITAVAGTQVGQNTTITATTYNLLFSTPVVLQPGVYRLVMAGSVNLAVATYPNNTARNPLLCNSDVITGYNYMIGAPVTNSGTTLPATIATSVNRTPQSRFSAPVTPVLIVA